MKSSSLLFRLCSLFKNDMSILQPKLGVTGGIFSDLTVRITFLFFFIFLYAAPFHLHQCILTCNCFKIIRNYQSEPILNLSMIYSLILNFLNIFLYVFVISYSKQTKRGLACHCITKLYCPLEWLLY